MAFRTQKTVGFLIAVSLWSLPAAYAQQEFRYDVRHDHRLGSCTGILKIDENGVSFQEVKKNKQQGSHAWEWPYQEIQQLELAPGKLRVLTYKDSRWKLGADREYEFQVLSGTLQEAYSFLRNRLDRRFVAALADVGGEGLWQLPVKHIGRIMGSDGLLIVGQNQIVFRTNKGGESRTWRYADIDNISSSDPFQLTLTTFERAKLDYGSRKQFNFQLKEALGENRYNELWRSLNRTKGLDFLSGIEQQGRRQ